MRKKYRNNLNRTIKCAKKSYSKVTLKIKIITKKLWKTVNERISLCQKQSKIFPT